MITALKFNIPQKKDFLIFDNLKINILEKYIGKSFNFIAFRKKEYNFIALIYALIFSFKTEFKVEYINFFLNFTNKKVLISFNYNRLILYRIKKYYPSVKIIIVQNGLCNNYFIDRPSNPDHILANYNCYGIQIPALIVKDNVIGCQFHPEKSGEAGLKILKNFMSMENQNE